MLTAMEKALARTPTWCRATIASFAAPTVGVLPLVATQWLSNEWLSRTHITIFLREGEFPGLVAFVAILGLLPSEFSLLAVILGILCAGCVGIPLHFLFRVVGWTGRRAYLIGGAVTALAAGALLGLLFRVWLRAVERGRIDPLPQEAEALWLLLPIGGSLALLIGAVIAGSIGGWVFWWTMTKRTVKGGDLAVS